jgi:hypothetical protein
MKRIITRQNAGLNIFFFLKKGIFAQYWITFQTFIMGIRKKGTIPKRLIFVLKTFCTNFNLAATEINWIDNGTSKLTTLIASISEEHDERVVGVATVASRGLSKGQIEKSKATAQIRSLLMRPNGWPVSPIQALFFWQGHHIESLIPCLTFCRTDKENSVTFGAGLDAAKAITSSVFSWVFAYHSRG